MFLVSRQIKGVIALLCGLVAGSLSLAAVAAMACEDHKTAMASSGLHIQQAWSPTAPPTIGVHAGYFTVMNHADAPQVIIGASSPVYERVEMHRTTLANGVASMQAVDAITIAPGEQVAFAPGDLHLMLMDAANPRATGDQFPVTLQLQNGETLTFQMTVKPMHMGDHSATPMADHSMHAPHRRHGD